MARKHQLRTLRQGTVINATSKEQEKEVIQALQNVVAWVARDYPVRLDHQKEWRLANIVGRLQSEYPDVEFRYHFERSSIRPDGGILHILSRDEDRFPILIAEVKNQGTNDLRVKEGLHRQARGNAIERLGKNVIGLRAALRSESIFPFVCFGYGCDFEPDSSILDRVATIAMFGELRQTHLHDEGPHGLFDRGSFYFREKPWSVREMADIMFNIAERSIWYYFSKYGKRSFDTS